MIWKLALFYLIMTLLGLGLALWRGTDRQFDVLGWPGNSPLFFLTLTVAVTAVIHLASRVWMQRSRRARRCGEEVRSLLGHLSERDLLILALASGVGEEMLFRGFLLNETGIWVSSIIFGLVHLPPSRNWLFWPVFAASMGLLLGWLCLVSNTLLWAILMHAGVNFLNLRLIMAREVA